MQCVRQHEPSHAVRHDGGVRQRIAIVFGNNTSSEVTNEFHEKFCAVFD
jgi:hypothetical protein